ncbi:phosphopantetheine-binding protein [Nocardia sp. NPDC050793]|uniref:phosphopantetheine-binding protein n=1 Tax=Nocardia sp. NPDC050793 TaxID=3155159 RepID=UPI0033DE3DF2
MFERDLSIELTDDMIDLDLIEDLGLDSVAFAIALVAMENATGVAVAEEDLLECKTVRDVNNFVRAYLEKESV